jgi:hypothetical protein
MVVRDEAVAVRKSGLRDFEIEAMVMCFQSECNNHEKCQVSKSTYSGQSRRMRSVVCLGSTGIC